MLRFGTDFHFRGAPHITAPIAKWAAQELQIPSTIRRSGPETVVLQTPNKVSTTDELRAITFSIQGFLSYKSWEKPIREFFDQWFKEDETTVFEIDLSGVKELDGTIPSRLLPEELHELSKPINDRN